jgi:hypothetical protein
MVGSEVKRRAGQSHHRLPNRHLRAVVCFCYPLVRATYDGGVMRAAMNAARVLELDCFCVVLELSTSILGRRYRIRNQLALLSTEITT